MNGLFNRDSSVYLILAAFCLLLYAIVWHSADGGIQFYLLVVAVLPAVVLALLDSRHLVPYLIASWAFGPEVRRLFDWAEGHFQPLSLVSLLPLIVSLCLLIPLLARPASLEGFLKTAARMFLVVLAYGLILGLAHNGLSSLYDLASYAAPLLILFYLAARPINWDDRNYWIRSLSTIAVLVAVYGWVQFLFAPAWDCFWMKSTGMASIGSPEPLKIRVFSTLNSPGPAAQFLAAAAAPMLMRRNWRGFFGWAGVLVVLSALALTEARSEWLMLIATVLVFILLSGKQRLPAIAGVCGVAFALTLLVPYLPGGDKIAARASSLTSLQKDGSAQARTNMAALNLSAVAGNPLGSGLGTDSLGSRLNNSGSVVLDNGYISLFFTFGLAGGLLVVAALWYSGRAAYAVQKATQSSEWLAPFSCLAVATVAADILGLASSNVFVGLGGFLTWMLIGCTFGLGRLPLPRPAAPLRRPDPLVSGGKSR